MATKYNPYNAVKKITELKGSYHTAKELGQDPTKYQQDAASYYNELRDNGYSDVADKLTLADYTKSLDILSGFNAPTEYDWYDNLTGDLMKEASKPVQSETVNQIMSAYNADNDRLNGTYTKDANGNVVSGLQTDLYNKASSQMDYIRNLDVTAQPWYENLMAQYQLGGQNAAKGALASGASSNSGNIDSYAAANANRQQLAYTTAGTQAALDTIAQQLAAYQNMYDSARAQLETMGAQNNERLDTAAKFYDTDSLERRNALNQAAELEKQKIQAQIDELTQQLGYDTAVYQADKGYEGTVYQSDKTLEGTQLTAEANKYGSLQDYLASVNSDAVKKQISDAELAQQAAELDFNRWQQSVASNGITFDMIKELLNEEYTKIENGTSPYKNLKELYDDYAASFGDFKDEIYEYLTDAKSRQKWFSENGEIE